MKSNGLQSFRYFKTTAFSSKNSYPIAAMTESLPSQTASIITSSMSELVLRSAQNFARADVNDSLGTSIMKILTTLFS